MGGAENFVALIGGVNVSMTYLIEYAAFLILFFLPGPRVFHPME